MIATWSALVYQQRDQGTRHFARRKPCPEESTTALMGLDQPVCIFVPLTQVDIKLCQVPIMFPGLIC